MISTADHCLVSNLMPGQRKHIPTTANTAAIHNDSMESIKPKAIVLLLPAMKVVLVVRRLEDNRVAKE
jgi:hypothetical protein